MGRVLFILSLLVTGSFSLADVGDEADQKALVEKLAKETRRELHKAGHINVETTPAKKLSLDELNAHYEMKDIHHETLSSEQYSELYSCHYRATCALWSFTTYSSIQAGSGTSAHFILIDTESGNTESFQHTTWEE